MADGDIGINWINYDLTSFVQDRKRHDFRYIVDSLKISAEFGWLPEIIFYKGLIKTNCWDIGSQNK